MQQFWKIGIILVLIISTVKCDKKTQAFLKYLMQVNDEITLEWNLNCY